MRTPTTLLKSSSACAGGSGRMPLTIALNACPGPRPRNAVARAARQACSQLSHCAVCEICAASLFETCLGGDDGSAVDATQHTRAAARRECRGCRSQDIAKLGQRFGEPSRAEATSTGRSLADASPLRPRCPQRLREKSGHEDQPSPTRVDASMASARRATISSRAATSPTL